MAGRGKVTYQDRQSLFLMAQSVPTGNLYQSAQPVALSGLQVQDDGFPQPVSQIFRLHLSAWYDARRTASFVIRSVRHYIILILSLPLLGSCCSIF